MHAQIRTDALRASILIVLLLPVATAADWPSQRGDAANTAFVGPAAGPPVTLAWEQATGTSLADSILVADGLVVVASKEHEIVALDAVDGSVQWRASVNGDVYGMAAQAGTLVAVVDGIGLKAWDVDGGEVRWIRTRIRDGGFGPPAIAGTTIVLASWMGEVVGVDIRTGTESWRIETSEGDASPPVVHEGLVLLAAGPDRVALDPRDGTSAWRTDAGYSANDGVAVEGGALLSLQGEGVGAHDATSGALRWERSIDSFGAGAPVAGDGKVFLVDGNGGVEALRVSDGKAAWRTAGYPATGGFLGERASGPSGDGDTYRRPLTGAYGGGRLFVAGPDQGLRIWNGQGGASIAVHDLGGRPATSPVIVDGSLYLGMTDGTVTAWRLTEGPAATDEDARDTPAVSSGAMLVALALGLGIAMRRCFAPRP